MALITVTINDKKNIEANEGTLLIDALSAQGIYLPSACGSSGKCGLCKVKVSNAAPISTDSEIRLLTEQERKDGFHLACQVKITSNLQIELPPEFLSAQDYVSVLEKKIFLTRDIVELTLKLVSPSSISFHAGQYITLKMPAVGDRKAAFRPFSIASSNTDHSFIQLNIRLNPEGTVTPWVFNELKEGQEVKFSGPRGNFYIRNSLRPMLFIAGGSGMAPVRSILKTLRDHKSNRPSLFFFGALTQADLFYLDEMQVLQKNLPDFVFTPALSNEPQESDWKGERGLITEVMDRIIGGSLSEYEAYLCGKPAMINVCIPLLEKKNIQKERVFYDLFNSPKQVK